MKKSAFKTLLLPLALIFLLGNGLQAQKLSANLGFGKFKYGDTATTLEYYLRVHTSTVNFVPLENGRYQASVRCKLKLKQGDNIKYTDEFVLTSPQIDSIAYFPHFNAQRRFNVVPGEYVAEVELDDPNTDLQAINVTQDLNLKFPNDKVSMSDIQLLDDYGKSASSNAYERNGFRLVTHNSTFYPKTDTTLKYYFEIYDIVKEVPLGEPFVVFLSVENAQNYKRDPNVGKFVKLTSEKDVAQLWELDIRKLPSGNYNFLVEVKDKDNNLLCVKRKYFERSNPSDEEEMELAKEELAKTFVADMELKDLRWYVASFRPIAEPSEDAGIRIIEKTEDVWQARNFFYSFWVKRYPDNPQYYWEKFKSWIDYADENLSAKTQRGYITGRGRVYLKYGPPNKIEDERNDPTRRSGTGNSAVPYEIWYYYNVPVTNQTNRVFVFVNNARAGYNYEMIHSNVKGEKYIDDWLGHMNWKTDLHQWDGNSRLDYSRDDGRFNGVASPMEINLGGSGGSFNNR